MDTGLIVTIGTVIPAMIGLIFMSGRTYQKVNGSHKIMKDIQECMINHEGRISGLEGYNEGEKRELLRKL